MKLAAILLLAFALRWIVTFWYPPIGAVRLQGDAIAYHEIAIHLVHGEGFVLPRTNGLQPTAQLAGPLYPLFLAAVYQPTDPNGNPDAARFVQVLLSVLTVWCVFLIGQHLFSEPVGVLAAFIAAIYPPFLHWSYYGGPAFLLTENLSVPLLTASIAALLTGWPFLAGLALGAAILSRATLLGLAILAALWMFSERLKFVAMVFCLGVLIVLTPWLIRNTLVFGVPLLSTQSGVVFWYANNPHASGGYVDTPILGAAFNSSDERETSRLGYEAGLKALVDRPLRIPILLMKKALTFWAPIDSSHEWHLNWGFLLVSLAAGVGWWKIRPDWHVWGFLMAPMVYLTLVAMVFFGDPRFRLPVEPLLIVLAARGTW